MSKNKERHLIEALFNHDDTILTRLYVEYAEKMKEHYLFKFPLFRLDSFPLKDIITDALLNLCKNPQKFDPQKSSLKTYLFRDVEGDILNLFKKRKSEKNKVHNNRVEVDNVFGNIELKSDTEEIKTDFDQVSNQFATFFSTIFSEEIDQKLAWMIKIEKDRETMKYSKLLGIEHLDSVEKEKIVKKHKDRINLRLKRGGYDNFIRELKEDS